jgi:hypothetical protein
MAPRPVFSAFNRNRRLVMRYHVVVAAAIVSAALVAGVGPAGAFQTANALTHNAIEATGSPLAELNGVAVEAATLSQTATLPQQQERVAGIIIEDDEVAGIISPR